MGGTTSGPASARAVASTPGWRPQIHLWGDAHDGGQRQALRCQIHRTATGGPGHEHHRLRRRHRPILIIFRQLRARELTARTALLPLAIVAWAGQHYLHGFTPAGNDLALITAFTGVGLALGVASAWGTRVWRSGDGVVLSRVGAVGVLTWIAGMGFRFVSPSTPTPTSVRRRWAGSRSTTASRVVRRGRRRWC